MKLKNQRSGITATLLLAMFVATPAISGQTYYRWLDPQGNQVNSDRPPPPGTDYQVVTMDANVTVSTDPYSSPDTPAAKDSPNDETGQVISVPPRMEVVKNPETCKAARKNLDTLNTHARIRVPDDNGNFRYINKEEKAIEKDLAQAAIDQNCE